MKKIFFLLFLFTLISCSKVEENKENNFNNINPKNIIEKQRQKYNDTSRIEDLHKIKSGLELYYQDNAEYPDNYASFKQIEEYIDKIPKDIISLQNKNECKFWYIYEVWDSQWIKNQIYKLSSCMESLEKSKNDWGNYKNKYEVWFLWKEKFKKSFYINWFNRVEKNQLIISEKEVLKNKIDNYKTIDIDNKNLKVENIDVSVQKFGDWWKIISFDASYFKKKWEIEWYLNDEEKPVYKWYKFKPSKIFFNKSKVLVKLIWEKNSDFILVFNILEARK